MATIKENSVSTPVNVITLINENILTNRKNGFDAEIDLPDLFARAKMIIAENTVIPVERTEE